MAGTGSCNQEEVDNDKRIIAALAGLLPSLIGGVVNAVKSG